MGQIYINSIMDNPSLCDGMGYRLVLFLQGCNLRCEGCQNRSTWDISCGKLVEIKELANEIRSRSINQKLTISGGEPLMQSEAVLELLQELSDFDLCLYTGHEIDKVPGEIMQYLKYIKVGPFIKDLKTSTKPFVGSENQEFMEVANIEKSKK